MRKSTHTVALAVLLTAAPAWAQVSAPPRYNEGPGIKLSDRLVLHPGVAVEGRYDSNVFAASASRGAPYLLVVGHLGFATLSPQRLTDGDGKVHQPALDFSLKSAFSGRIYLSGDDKVTSQSAFEADVSAGLNLFPGRPFSVSLSDVFDRTVSPVNADSPANLPRITNTGTVTLRIKPGGGRLTFDLGYTSRIDLLEDDQLNATDKLFHNINFVGKWRLLPKTAVSIEVTQQFVDNFRATAASPHTVPSKPLRIYAGIAGLLTPAFSVMLKAGYGNAFYDSGPSFSGPLAKAELGLAFTSLKLRVGYDFGFQDSRFLQYYRSHRIYASYDQQVGRLVLLYVTGSLQILDFEGSRSTRSLLGAGTAGIDFQLLDWLYVGAGYQIDARTDPDPALAGVVGLSAYTRHQVFGRVGVSY